ncbi:MAG TPA: potassium channel family protein [Candidatus Acidoferrum sp.]|nr:potassium channel family protein [Candidatus Acidoferrum sp.]
MPDLSALLAKIPDEYKPIAALGIGACMLVFLVLLHGAGLHAILVFRARREHHLRVGRPRLVAALLLFSSSVFLMLSLHIVEFLVWGFALIRMGLIAHINDAIYFCANAYTTLGYGNVDLGPHWRNIAPIMGISGLFTFAWTTSALVTVVSAHRKLIEQLEEERVQEVQLRFALRKEEWNSLKSERDSERLERETVGAQAAGASLFQWRRIRRAERKRIEELRSAKVAEIEELRRNEREEERKLVPGEPPKNLGDKK